MEGKDFFNTEVTKYAPPPLKEKERMEKRKRMEEEEK